MSADKFRPPMQSAPLLRRPRLERRLDAATEPVVVISAPAGAGKTVLLADWAQGSMARGECAWLCLDEYDNAPARFWDGVLQALRQVRTSPDLPRRCERWSLDFWADELLPALQAGLRNGPRCSLVLDGLEHVPNEDVARSLGDFLTRLPAGIRVVLSTRHVPGAPVPALRARGMVAELDQSDLRFTSEEASAWLAELLGAAPAADFLSELYAAAEGWAAGLCLVGRALARRGSGVPEGYEVTPGAQAVADYLSTEVLDRLTTEQRAFLLRTSVLEELSTESCRAVVGGERAGVLLRELVRTVQLIVPVSADPPTYRHHRALSALLWEVLASESPGAVMSLHRAAAQWYAGRRQTAAAVRHCLLSGDPSSAVSAVLAGWEGAVAAGRTADVAGWLSLLPDRAVSADPRLCVVAGLTALSDGDPEAAGRWLDVAQARQAGSEGAGRGSTVTSVAAVARAVACCLRGEILSAARISAMAGACTAPLTFWHALACVARGTALLWQGQGEEADGVLGEAVRDAHAAGHHLVLIRALGARAVGALVAGRHRQARTLSDEALRIADTCGLEGHFVAALAHISRAGLLVEETDLEESEAALARAEAALAGTARAGSEPHARALLHHLKSSLARARQDSEAARAARDAARHVAGLCESPGLLTELLARAGGRSASGPDTEPAASRPKLSLREQLVLRALCGPLTLREIAAEFHVSHNTVKTQVRAIFRKLGAHDRRGAVATARERGVL